MSEIDLDFNGLDVSKIDMNLKHLYYFIVVAETGSITRSAQKLYVTQPLLSKNIMALEETVGMPLFYRDSRSLTLTKTGKYLYTRWKKLINNFRNDMEQACLMSQDAVDQIRIGCFPVLNTYGFLKAYTDRLHKRHPDLSVEMYRMNYIRLLEHLNARKVDIIFTLYEDLPENREFYEWKIIASPPLTAVVSCDDPLSDYDMLTFSMLSGHLLLINEPDGNLSRATFVQTLLQSHHIHNETVRYVNNDLTAYLAAEQGHGIALGIRALYPVHNQRVKILDIQDTAMPVAAVWNRDCPQDMKNLIHYFLE